jgi:integrase
MRIYRPSYSKAIPEGAQILKRKAGDFCKYQDHKGHTRTERLSKSGKVICETNCWVISFRDNNDVTRTVKAYTNEQASRLLAGNVERLLYHKANNIPADIELLRWAESIPSRIRNRLAGWGLLDEQAVGMSRPLAELLGEFGQALRRRERTEKYIRSTTQQLARLFGACRFNYWSDISSRKVTDYLQKIRDRGDGSSKRTYNGYVKTIRQFCKWVVQEQKAGASPVAYLKGLDRPETDKRHERRAATVDELRRLLETTIRGPERFGMTGYERYLVYRFAAESGLRANEIRLLRINAFDFDNMVVKVKAGCSKGRHEDMVPLRARFAQLLRDFFVNKLPTAKAFGGTYEALTDHPGKMLQMDLQDANIEYIDDSGRYLDFHALRHTFITNLKAVSPRVAQSLARHKSSAMTDKYSHFNLDDDRRGLETLPDLGMPSRENQNQVATGTDGDFLRFSCSGSVQPSTMLDCHRQIGRDNEEKTRLSADNAGSVETLNQ